MEVDEPKILETPETEIIEKEEITKLEEEKSEPLVEEAKEEIEKPKSPEAEKVEEKKEELVEIKEEPIERPEGEPKIIDTVVIDDDDTLPEKPEASTKKSEARFPDMEIFKPLMQMKQFDAMLKGDVKDNLKALSRVFDTSMIVKWFREFALEKRISHIIYCVEKGVWPVGKSYSAYSGCLGIDLDLPLYETVKRLNADKRSSSSTPDVITITTDHHQLSKSVLSSQLQAQMQSMSDKSKKAQKRHIAIDVETERAKLHALLNNTGPLGVSAKSSWNEDDHELRRASGSSGSSLQPPPAHQHVARSSANSQYTKPSVTIPGTSSTLTPIDLSSR
jgi:chromodomain-helicase-DNA-binding protein 7